MESAVVSLVVKKLGGMLIDKINEEASLVLSFTNELEWLRKKLTYISGCLREADVQGAHDKTVKSWLLEVADIALDAEDILDECSVQYPGTAYIDDETPQSSSSSSCFCAFNFRKLGFRHKMARRIKDVKDRLRSIMKDGKGLKLFRDLAARSDLPSTISTLQDFNFRGTSLTEIGSNPVAIQPKVDEVLRLLDDRAAAVIAVVGMGGVGKTFLMRNVFDRIKNKFKKSVWLSISQTYSIRKLQADIASEIELNEFSFGQVSDVQAAKLIHDRLASTRCLVVLDDVWTAARPEYNTLAKLISALGIPLMGSNTSQCKVVVTTRSRDVGAGLDARVYELHPLSEEESWKLFCAFAFPYCHQNQPPRHLEGIARQVERECGRLPLAVRVVAASLAGDRSSTKWESKLRQLKAVVSHSEDPIMQILKLSYDSLPADLKPCFASLSFFPEDQEIVSENLINLWVAEGYVPKGEDQQDIGWKYICHLQNLCLVERGVIYEPTWGLFTVHDLLLDLAISISKESQCVFSAEEALKKDPTVQGSSRYRRILMAKKSIGDGDVNVLASNRAYSASRLRALSFSNNEGIENIPAMLLSSARVLRVLDLSSTNITSLPDCVGDLKLLRFLNLRRTHISEVPECVKNNKSLLFLDISECGNLERLPEWIGELSCLQHLHIKPAGGENRFNGLMPNGISKLVSLQVLGMDGDNKLSVEENGPFLRLDHFVNLVSLREVRIDIRHEAELKSIEDGILATLVKMRTLSIYNWVEGHVAEEGNLPPLSENMLAMKHLEYLYLESFAVPKWICRFSNLKQLSLSECHCIEYPALEMMPNLINLDLYKNRNCKALPKGFGKPGGFPQLRYFKIDRFGVLEELPELEDGAMPHLEILQVAFCDNLKKVPAGLELLKSLKECDFSSTGARHMFEEGSELWNKMKAKNPNVRIWQ